MKPNAGGSTPVETLMLYGCAWGAAFLGANALGVLGTALGGGFETGRGLPTGAAVGMLVVYIVTAAAIGHGMGAGYVALSLLLQRLGPARNRVRRSLGISVALLGLLGLAAPLIPLVLPWGPIGAATLAAGWLTPWLVDRPGGEAREGSDPQKL